ncbi:hypothetical protein GYMLUDRAFT_94744 [Collybiopsis luxurians FD-317 M1]|nr:hypothetical protein GYMLUDRAFT_94744 [Collybiopsis luxurians FD-317 M1]
MSIASPVLCLNCQAALDGLATDVDPKITDYQNLLQKDRTNQGHDHYQLQSDLDEANSDLDFCDRAIAELEEQLARFKDRRHAILQKRIVPIKSLLSPIQKLPPEILLQIFFHVARQIRFPAITSLELGKFTSPIFGLTWVCSWWRTLILSEREMWSSFKMHFLWVQNISPGHIEAMGECFEERAKNIPVQFSVEGIEYLPAMYIAPVLDMVIRSVQRWKGAVFDFGGNTKALEYLGETLQNVGTLEYPFLESLTLRHQGFGGFGPFRRCPRLRELQVSYLSHSDLIDLHNLTILKIVNGYTGPSLACLLMQCPTLETLSLGGFEPVFDLDPPDIDYHHTHLSYLDIVLVDLSETIWEGLHLPALTHLSFRFWRHSDEGVGALASLLTRSNCSLEKITMHYPHIKQDQWERFLDNTASVIRPDTLILSDE